MNTLSTKIAVMQKIGTGLSVDSLCRSCNITYNQLCEIAQEYPDVYYQLKRWYKRYDFMPVDEPKEEPVSETESKPLETNNNHIKIKRITKKKVVSE